MTETNLDELPREARKALDTFPEFEISDFNESGANGYVLLGHHRVLQRPVALKIYFHEDSAIDQEPALLALVNHKNVLKVHDARKLSETCSFYMTPSAHGGDLARFLENHSLSTGLAHSFLCQLLSGIAALHDSCIGIVHRDLKPENLLVHDGTIMIADFGSARQIDTTTGAAPASKHSILFRPPEAFGSSALFDRRSDVYQAGLLGYMLFGGSLTNDLLSYLTTRELAQFRKISADDAFATSQYIDGCIEKRIKNQRLLDWSSVPCFVPEPLKRVLRKATKSHPQRYHSASEFLSELARVRNDLPDWVQTANGAKLANWNGYDYLVELDGGKYRVKRRMHASRRYRADNSYTAGSFPDVVQQLKERLGLP